MSTASTTPTSPHRSGESVDSEGMLSIPRRVNTDEGVGMTGFKHGPDLLAMYGPNGKLFAIFDSARELDIVVEDGPDDQPVTRADLMRGQIEETDAASAGVTYFIGGDAGAVKIGRTTSLSTRLKDIQSCSPIPVHVLATRNGGDREKLYHRLFAAHRLHGEWFTRSPEIEAEIERIRASTPSEPAVRWG